MKYKISIHIADSDIGIRKNQLCEMINKVHSEDYTYSPISFKFQDVNVLGIIANDFFEKYNFNLNELEEELSEIVQKIRHDNLEIYNLKMKDGTPLNIYMLNVSLPSLPNPEPANPSEVTYIESEGDMPF